MLDEDKAIIISAYPSEVWPGKAAVVTSRVHIKKGGWNGGLSLNNQSVSYISAFLSAREDWSLMRLSDNESQVYQGSAILGLGFTISENEANALISENPKNAEVLYPYLNGKELNSNSAQSPGRWVINFFDWGKEKSSQYNGPFEVVVNKVKPERQAKKPNGDFKVKKVRAENWWKYAETTAGLYHSIGRGHSYEKHPKEWDPSGARPEKVIASCIVSKHLMFSFVPNEYVFSNLLNIFSFNKYSDFSILQSTIHSVFAWKHASRLETRLRYTPKSVYLPYPKPRIDDLRQLDLLGEKYHELRSLIMKNSDVGLTKLYNRFHNPEDIECKIIEMRGIHQKIDESVAEAYGWNDLDLEHDFHSVDYLPENDRVRFTISEKARNEVLDRLTLLNKQRFDEEQKEAGSVHVLAGKKYKKSSNDQMLDKVAEPRPQGDLFGSDK
jgi:hypothetical protein